MKKLSELKDNEYMYCDCISEVERVTGYSHTCALSNRNGEGVAFMDAFKSDCTIVYPSTDFADYEEPKPVRPKFNSHNYWDNGYNYIKYGNDMGAYCDHLEKELESKVFVPFKVKVVYNVAGLSKDTIYIVHYEYNDCYFVEKPNGKMDYMHKSYCKKID